MYTNVWSKYLPVIRIVFKKALVSEQVLNLNIPDFERAGMTRKSGYKFMIRFHKGKVENVIVSSPVASSLSSLLLQDPGVKALLAAHDFQISMNPKFQLTIRHLPEEPVGEAHAVSEQKA